MLRLAVWFVLTAYDYCCCPVKLLERCATDASFGKDLLRVEKARKEPSRLRFWTTAMELILRSELSKARAYHLDSLTGKKGNFAIAVEMVDEWALSSATASSRYQVRWLTSNPPCRQQPKQKALSSHSNKPLPRTVSQPSRS
jgi:hypothetical protein